MDGPKVNSTFVVDKKLKENIEECLSPEMFSPENGISTNQNKTYNLSDKCVSKKVSKKLVKNMNIMPEDSTNSAKINSVTNEFSTLNCCSNNKRYLTFVDVLFLLIG